VYDTATDQISTVTTTGAKYSGFIYWVYSGAPPGVGGGDAGSVEPPRWRSSSFVAVSGLTTGYQVAFKGTPVAGGSGIYLGQGPATVENIETVLDTTTAGTSVDPQAPAGSVVTAVGLERDGFRGRNLALSVSMLNSTTSESWAGVYLTTAQAIPLAANALKDYNGDGTADVLARDKTGNLWLYPGNGTGGWLTPRLVGNGWNVMTAIVAPGDFTGDGNADVLARDTTGNLWLYPGNGTGGWLTPRIVGNGCNVMTAIVGAGDFNGDHTMDVLARDTTGNLWLYPGNGSGGWLAPRIVGNGWNVMTAIVGPGDFNGDGPVDVLARDTGGRFWLYPGSGTGGWLAPRQIGVGWNGMTAIL
jgi:hypothetical protein